MPYTPYHFGQSGFIGLLFHRWIDFPVFVLANVIVDLEVLADSTFQAGWPVHQFLHFHTLLIGAAVGIAWGLVAYLIKPVRRFFERMMKILHIPYKAGLIKSLISGVLGVWLHVVIDSIYHYDVQMLWPSRARPLWRLLRRGHIRVTQEQIEIACIVFFIATILLYALTVILRIRKNKIQKARAGP